MIPDVVQQLLAGRAILAPMLATTDIPFRAVCREFGVVHASTEMVSAKGIVEGLKESFRCAVFDPAEGAISMQVVAATAGMATQAIHELSRMHPTIIDINCGCPNERICDAGAGAKLLEDPKSLESVVRAAVRASTVPVSAKVRMSAQHREESMRAIVRAVEDAGASFITVHARSRSAAYDQPAHWDAIAIAKDEASIPVVGNGDVFSSADAFRMMDQTGCDAVMIARGALGTPWIFRDIALGRRCGIDEHLPSVTDLADVVRRHVAMLAREFGPILSLPRLRKHVAWYTRYFEGADDLRHLVFRNDDISCIQDAIAAFFALSPLPLSADAPARLAMEKAFRHRVLYWLSTPAPEQYLG
ncbi:MAG: tRNA-dihydrouridine synthase [Ignavibacteria bacterium]|nr:tRNA-dihydrouridine synthase [Ignavibacteria bacterium]